MQGGLVLYLDLAYGSWRHGLTPPALSGIPFARFRSPARARGRSVVKAAAEVRSRTPKSEALFAQPGSLAFDLRGTIPVRGSASVKPPYPGCVFVRGRVAQGGGGLDLVGAAQAEEDGGLGGVGEEGVGDGVEDRLGVGGEALADGLAGGG